MRRSPLALAALLLCAMGPFEKNHPLVDDGAAAYERGEFEQALEKFNAAERELPSNAAVEYNRGLALHKLGRHEEARQALLKAADLDKGELASKIHYNLGNVWAATSNKKEAIAEYRKALRKDPGDEQARHNLEVLLKDLPPPEQKNQPDGGQPDGGKADAGRPDAGPDGGKGDGGAPTDGGAGDSGMGDGGDDGGADGGTGPDGGGSDGGKGDGGQGEGDKSGDGGQSSGEKGDGGSDGGQADLDGGEQTGEASADLLDAGMSQDQAKKLLDSMKNSEKNLQLWRFQKKSQRKPNEKDW